MKHCGAVKHSSAVERSGAVKHSKIAVVAKSQVQGIPGAGILCLGILGMRIIDLGILA